MPVYPKPFFTISIPVVLENNLPIEEPSIPKPAKLLPTFKDCKEPLLSLKYIGPSPATNPEIPVLEETLKVEKPTSNEAALFAFTISSNKTGKSSPSNP